ncbi:tagaturonate reductase [Panacibacter sp. DH6]|uniref:Tagaturonate reductase n=1 Tax=Panacibacter microcysteis TaxID=2793269 RepID=A0A931H069_9BACT|nr:tagaturonate reductase [Panacibacter microcysteis]MBG9378583.1 tagaturonate reductase [Panacibacter microcysteis]
MQLSKATIADIQNNAIEKPEAALFLLPEKVLQFGTGVLLRGLCDYYIDKANRQGVFNGRVVVVKSTTQGSTDAFAQQDNLYTHIIRGVKDGNTVEQTIINAAVSRVLAASEEWDSILACAANKAMQLIISNTTEVGITFIPEHIMEGVPGSYPGKLLRWLYERYQCFDGSSDAGMIIIPTELLTDNAKKLRDILLQLASHNRLGEAFIQWLQNANSFCNSLVDRIVPGKASTEDTGYTDDLAIMSEVYSLWAIESSDGKVIERLSFAQTDTGVVVAPDIYKFRELKLRLLNGTHTLSCGLAVLAGFATVKEAMADKAFRKYVETVMLQEIAPAVTGSAITAEEANVFGMQVLDRFANPFIEHQWLSITLQYSSKMLMRNLPVLQQYYSKFGTAPRHIALGFAAYCCFMKSVQQEDGKYSGTVNGRTYAINDDKASLLHIHWQKSSPEAAVKSILSDEKLWHQNLDDLPGFTAAVTQYCALINQHGARQLIQNRL